MAFQPEDNVFSFAFLAGLAFFFLVVFLPALNPNVRHIV